MNRNTLISDVLSTDIGEFMILMDKDISDKPDFGSIIELTTGKIIDSYSFNRMIKNASEGYIEIKSLRVKIDGEINIVEYIWISDLVDIHTFLSIVDHCGHHVNNWSTNYSLYRGYYEVICHYGKIDIVNMRNALLVWIYNTAKINEYIEYYIYYEVMCKKHIVFQSDKKFEFINFSEKKP